MHPHSVSSPLSLRLLSFLNSPSFADIAFHIPYHSDKQQQFVNKAAASPAPFLHNGNIINPLRHSLSLTLPPPCLSPSPPSSSSSFLSGSFSSLSDARCSPQASPYLSSSSLSASPSPQFAALDEEQPVHAHRVVLAGRSPYWHRVLSSLSSSSQLAPVTYPTLSSSPVLSLLPSPASSDFHSLSFSVRVHPDALLLLLRFVYCGKVDLSFLDAVALDEDGGDADGGGLDDDLRDVMSAAMLRLRPHSRLYVSVVTLHLLLFSHLFELQQLYFSLTKRCCNTAPALLQRHLRDLAAIRAASAALPSSPLQAGSLPMRIPESHHQSRRSESFLSSSLLRFGAHDATTGAHIRIRATHRASVGVEDAEAGGLVQSTVVKCEGGVWRRYKVDPLLLACRSGFFHAMFSADWRENQLLLSSSPSSPSASFSPRSAAASALALDVVLQDINRRELEDMLQFIYTDDVAAASGDEDEQAEEAAASPFLLRSLPQLSIENEWTLRLLSDDRSGFQHLVSLLSLSVLYNIPALTEHAQQSIGSRLSIESVCAVWPLVLTPFFSPSTAQPEDERELCAASSSPSSPPPAAPFHTELDVLHDHCLRYTSSHFMRVSRHPSFLSLPLPLLKQTLDPGTVECDSRGMIEALERWIERRVAAEGWTAAGDAQQAEDRRQALRLCLFPPSTLFNRSEKSKVLNGDVALFRRLGWAPPVRG